MSERLTYRFGPLERRGLLGPVRPGQALIIVLGLLAGVVGLDVSPGAAGAIEAIAALTLAVTLALAPVAGRTCEEWAPVAGRHLTRRILGRTTFRSRVAGRGVRSDLAGRTDDRDRTGGDRTGGDRTGGDPTGGDRTGGDREGRSRRGRARHVRAPKGGERNGDRGEPPPGLSGLELVEIPYRGRTIGAISELRGRRLTAVLACRVLSFALLDAETQERRLSRWGTLLSATAGTPIRRLQWVERTGPAESDELARWLHDARDPGIPLRGEPIVESYLELIASSAEVAQDHEILLAVQVDAGRLRDRRPEALTEGLVEQAERVAQNLQAAEVDVVGALGLPQLAWTLRTAFDPYARADLARLRAVDPARQGLGLHAAWPLATAEAWDHLRCDGALHATFWIGGWPRVDVSPMFMDAMLGSSAAVRSIAVSFEPIAPERSAREAEAAITRDRADRELRRRFGQSETARQRVAQEAALRREAELADGHAEVRLAGFVTVSGRDPADLRRGCREVLDHAARARLELHRMYGQQEEAFTFTLPLARGLR